MREILSDLERWQQAGERSAVARVVDLEGSGPRSPGAAMAVTAGGEVVGSVSGGCVEGAVVTESLDVIETGRRRIVTFGYSDDEAFAVGLTCGGTIHLFVEPLEWGPVHAALAADLAQEAPAALATVVEGPGTGAKMLVRPAVRPRSDRWARPAWTVPWSATPAASWLRAVRASAGTPRRARSGAGR